MRREVGVLRSGRVVGKRMGLDVKGSVGGMVLAVG
jgi:hypothetical protein